MGDVTEGLPTADQRRKERQARALEIVKAIRRNPDQTNASTWQQSYMPSEEKTPEPLRHTELAGTNPEPTGYVYFVYCAGRIKIGYATEVRDRMFSIGTHCPFPISLLLTVRGSLEDEQKFHDQFAGERVNKEWFDLPLGGDLYHFLWRNLCDDGFEIWEDAQHETRELILDAAANVINLTGGDSDGQVVRGAEWPSIFEVDDDFEGELSFGENDDEC